MKRIHSLLIILVLVNITANAQQWGLYTLYSVKNTANAYLIDTNGTTYKTWTFNSSKKTAYSSYLVPGDTLVRTVVYTGNVLNGGGVSGEVQKVDWNGNITWDYICSGANYVIHHDICPMPNGNVLMICYEVKTGAEAIQAGSTGNSYKWTDKIIEVKPTGPTTGTVVWEWHAWNHLCQDHDASKDNYVSSIVQNPQLINLNYSTNMDFMHTNGLDYNAALDQITFSTHFYNEIYVIDHSSTTAEAASHTGGRSGKGGDILYRWGNPAAYEATGSANFNVVHDAHWVPKDCPNANYLAGFNNKGGTGSKSAIDVFAPPYDTINGDTILYSHTPGAAYLPPYYAWRYTATTQTQDEGNSQQLPNGNSLMCLTFSNSIIEINSAGTVLWTKSTSGGVSQAFRYSKCYVRGPVASAGASVNTICPNNPVTLNSSATSVTELSPTYTYSWSSNPAGFTSTLQNPIVTPTGSGTYIYTVIVTNNSLGCSDTASITVLVNPCTEIDKTTNIKSELNVFPNPATGVLNLEGDYCNSEIIIYNSYGKMMFQQFNVKSIDLSEFSNGIYYLMMKSGSKIVATKKIIVIK